MEVTSVANAASATTQRSNDQVSKMEFLNLLVAQLNYQDPLDPIKNQDFSAQMAQFSSLEEMTKMNKNLSRMLAQQALSDASVLIGKLVYGKSAGGEDIIGVVQGVQVQDGVAQLDIEGTLVPMENVAYVMPNSGGVS
ncbi:MAG: hypothetical protein NC924_02250 [Candidatus Omnitrophica bacterium]|nr:hypothetical protein [Candidatus Omnitrophota bacterium]